MFVFQMSCLPGHCRTSEELKYTMTRLAIDGVDLFVVEHGCAANIKAGSHQPFMNGNEDNLKECVKYVNPHPPRFSLYTDGRHSCS